MLTRGVLVKGSRACRKAKAAFKFAERPSPLPSIDTLLLKSRPTNIKALPVHHLLTCASKIV